MIWFVFVLCRADYKLKEQILAVLLRHGELYGLQIIDLIEQEFGRKVNFGSLYPTLHRLERDGLVTARWGDEQPIERGRARRRYYRRTGSRSKLKEREKSTATRLLRFVARFPEAALLNCKDVIVLVLFVPVALDYAPFAVQKALSEFDLVAHVSEANSRPQQSFESELSEVLFPRLSELELV